MPERFRDRPTADLVVIFMTAVIGILVLGSFIAGILIEFYNPEIDTSGLLHLEGEIVKSFTAIVVGYLAGRGVSGKE